MDTRAAAVHEAHRHRVLTSSSETVGLNRSSQLGANSFVVKPPTPEELPKLAEAFKLWWLRQNRVAC